MNECFEEKPKKRARARTQQQQKIIVSSITIHDITIDYLKGEMKTK